MARDRHTLTDGQWEHLGSIVGDFLWDQDEFHAVLEDFLGEQGISNERMSVFFDDTFRRLEAGFARPKKG